MLLLTTKKSAILTLTDVKSLTISALDGPEYSHMGPGCTTASGTGTYSLTSSARDLR